jgi:hypothetical protein
VATNPQEETVTRLVMETSPVLVAPGREAVTLQERVVEVRVQEAVFLVWVATR